MRYRRVYVEITSMCNLDCSFCVKRTVRRPNLSYEDFVMIANQLKEYTDTVYYHVLGEPLLHPDLDRMMQYADSLSLRSAITTNGVLLHQKLGKWKGLRISRINVSLHACLDPNNRRGRKDAMNIVETAEQIQEETGTMVFFRLWDSGNPDQAELEKEILERYGVTVSEDAFHPNGIALTKGLRLQKERRFVWPKDAKNGERTGFCQGLRTHFAILSDGTAVPCCLDADGTIALGNVKTQSLKEILEGERARSLYEGFSMRKANEELCRNCEFKNRFGG